MKQLAYGVLVFAIVLFSALAIAWAVGAEYDDTADESFTVENETLTADVGNWTALSPPTKASFFYDNESIEDASGGQLSEGSDYEFNATEGTVLVYASGSVTDGDTLTVSYVYAGPSEGTRLLFGVIELPVRYVLPASILLSFGFTMVGLAIGLHRFAGQLTGSGGTRFSRR